jgi:hypothetical protein
MFRYLGIAPHKVFSQDWLLEHLAWAMLLFWPAHECAGRVL